MTKPGIFANIPVADLERDYGTNSLNRSLGPVSLTALGIGGIIGTGIFVLSLGFLLAAQHANPAVVLSFVVAGLGCIFAGLCYAEFAAMVPVSGCAYAYTYATLGEFTAWFVGWNLVLEYMFACATVAVGWSRYFVTLLNNFPHPFSCRPVCSGYIAAGNWRPMAQRRSLATGAVAESARGLLHRAAGGLDLLRRHPPVGLS